MKSLILQTISSMAFAAVLVKVVIGIDYINIGEVKMDGAILASIIAATTAIILNIITEITGWKKIESKLGKNHDKPVFSHLDDIQSDFCNKTGIVNNETVNLTKQHDEIKKQIINSHTIMQPSIKKIDEYITKETMKKELLNSLVVPEQREFMNALEKVNILSTQWNEVVISNSKLINEIVLLNNTISELNSKNDKLNKRIQELEARKNYSKSYQNDHSPSL